MSMASVTNMRYDLMQNLLIHVHTSPILLGFHLIFRNIKPIIMLHLSWTIHNIHIVINNVHVVEYHVFDGMKPNCSAHSRHPDFWKAKFQNKISWKLFVVYMFLSFLCYGGCFGAFPHYGPCVTLLVCFEPPSHLPGATWEASKKSVEIFYWWSFESKLISSHKIKKLLFK